MRTKSPVGAPRSAGDAAGRRPGFGRSLQIRNYRLYFYGQMASMAGTWMQATGLAWLVVKQLKGEGSDLGLMAMFQFLPLVFLGPWAGLLADRHERRKILLLTQSWLAITAAFLSVMVLTHHVTLPIVFIASLMTGFGNAFDNPARQSFASELVPREHISNAVALNSSAINGARVVGPALAGIVIATLGTGWCFVINALSFLAVLGALLSMRQSDMYPLDRPPVAKGQVRAGILYGWRNPVLRETLLTVGFISTFAFNHQVVMPLVAKDTFSGGAATLAVFSSCNALGSVTASILAARRRAPTRELIVGAVLAYAVALLLAGLAPSSILEGVALGLMGLAVFTMLLSASATLQLQSDPSMRGRVMALYGIVLLGSTPIGGPLTGVLMDHTSPRWGWGMGAIASLIWAAVLWLRAPAARRASDALDALDATGVGAPAGSVLAATRASAGAR